MKISEIISKHLITTLLGTAINAFIVSLVSDLNVWACVLCGYLMSELISSSSTISDLKEEVEVLRNKLGRIEERMYKNNSWE